MDHSEIRRRANEALGAQYCLAGLPPEQAWANKWLLASNNFKDEPATAQGHIKAVAEIAAAAQTYAATTEMTNLVGQAAEDLMFQWQEGDTVPEVLLPYDLPAKYGFVLFSHHLRVYGDYDTENLMPTLGYLWADIAQVWEDHGTDSRLLTGIDVQRGGVILVPFSSPDRWISLGVVADDPGETERMKDWLVGAPRTSAPTTGSSGPTAGPGGLTRRPRSVSSVTRCAARSMKLPAS